MKHRKVGAMVLLLFEALVCCLEQGPLFGLKLI